MLVKAIQGNRTFFYWDNELILVQPTYHNGLTVIKIENGYMWQIRWGKIMKSHGMIESIHRLPRIVKFPIKNKNIKMKNSKITL